MYDSMCVYKTLENANKSSVTTINWSLQDGSWVDGTKKYGKDLLQKELEKLFESDEYVPYPSSRSVFTSL